jgi:hypothetical protein
LRDLGAKLYCNYVIKLLNLAATGIFSMVRMVLYPGKQDKVLLIPSPVFIQIRPWAM